MNPRVRKLRQQSLDTVPSISVERAVLLTDFYRDNLGKWPQPVLRARAFHHLCANKTVFIGDGELIVGERGHEPKATPTYPEISCHSVDDLRTLNDRPMTSYAVSDEDIERYEREVIPFWGGRTLRERMFADLPAGWHEAFAAGVFTEFMEQRAPGHTVADGSIYEKGLLDLKAEIADAVAALDQPADRDAVARRDQLEAMDIAADAAILYAERHAARVEEMALAETDPVRRAELEHIAEVCRRVPPPPPPTKGGPCRPTGSTTSGSSPSSTVGTPSTPATSTSTWRPFSAPGSPTAASTANTPKSCSNACGSSSTTTPHRRRWG